MGAFAQTVVRRSKVLIVLLMSFEKTKSNSGIILWGVMAIENLPQFIQDTYEIHEWNHASAILENDFPDQWKDIIAVLTDFRLFRSHVLAGGGGKSKISQSLDGAFYDRGWKEHDFETKITVDDIISETPTHKVDCVKGKIAIEIEWSNKDPFFDRDLNNFRLLFDRDAIDVGIIITKSNELREIFESLGKKIWDKYGTSTTWMNKLLPRIDGGGGGGCPILVFGITGSLYVED